MSDQLSKLLSKKSYFDQLHEDTQALLIRLKQANDSLQRNSDMEYEGRIQIVLKQQEQSMSDLVQQARSKIADLEKASKGYDQKKQSKKLKDFYAKELERNKKIMKDQVKVSVGSDSEEDKSTSVNEASNYQIVQQEQLQVDYDRLLIQERGHEINHIETETIKLNSMMNEIAAKVDEQDHHLDIIHDDVFKTKENVENANKQIIEANQRSRDAKKKYIIFALLAFLVASIVIAYFLYFQVFF